MNPSTKPTFELLMFFSICLCLTCTYYYAYPFWKSVGFTNANIEEIILLAYRSGTFKSEFLVKSFCLFLGFISSAVKRGNSKDSSWKAILIPLCSGMTVYYVASLFGYGLSYIFLTVAGFITYLSGAILLGRKYRSYSNEADNYEDSFPQCEMLLENKYSINIPITYQYQKKLHHGYINVVNPFRGSMVIGTPGSGKSYSIYGPFIHQMIKKAYSLFVYDYKYPDLTERVLNELLDNYTSYDIRPHLYVVNFDDPLYSHRFNPIHPRYLTDPIDSTEIAEVIMKNASREANKNDNFFSLSATCYVDLLIWFLKIYEDGQYCTFPHLIELMGQDYREVFKVMEKYDDLEVKRNTFADAIKDQAYEQLQGQIASARIPLSRFASKTLYWTLSGDDFSLDINDPQNPKIICVGNNPKRQSVYGTTLAMLMSQLFKVINTRGKRHSAVLIDELPTIYLKGLDNLINTARSNKVAVVIGAQDKSQLVKDYDKKESDVIFSTVGNVFAGAVKAETAQSLSKSFGKYEKEMKSFQEGENSDHISYSYQLRDLLPPHKIEAFSQGTFCGYVSDLNEQKVNPKIFCGEVDAGGLPKHHARVPKIILNKDKDEINNLVNQNYQKIRRDIMNLIHSKLDEV